MKPLPYALLIGSFVAAAGCTTSLGGKDTDPPVPESSEGAVRSDSRTVSAADLAAATQLNLLDYLRAERPRWLTLRSARAGAILVYVDDTRLGTIETLSSIPPKGVHAVRYFDAAAGQAKFATRTAGAVIQVIMR